MTAPALPPLAQAESLDPSVVRALRDSDRRIVIAGAGGWIGKSLLAGLRRALGESEMQRRVACFGSSRRSIDLGQGRAVAQAPLAEIGGLAPHPSIVFHLAFLTKDKVAGMAEGDYVAANRRISATVQDCLARIGADRVFVASSGAAAFADDEAAAPDLRLYGRLKRDDEIAFARWAEEAPGRRALIMRIYSLAGAFINKHDTYALADFVRDALARRTISVMAPMEVHRGYVAVREMLSLVLASLLDEGPVAPVTALDSGGEAMELAELAQLVARRLGGHVTRAPVTRADGNRYIPDTTDYANLLAAYRLDKVELEQAVAETAAYLAQGGRAAFQQAVGDAG